MDYGKGYSFSQEYRQPEIKTKFERNQIKSKLGFIPEQEIMICGLADPMFRAAEAIMKYFDGYYISRHKDDLSKAKGLHLAIKKRNTFGIPVFAYFMHDWVYVRTYFNVMDNPEIRNLYDMTRFERVEYKNVYKSLSNTGISRN